MEQFFREFLEAISPALQALIVALVTVLLGQATVYVQKKYEQLKASVSSDKRYLLDHPRNVHHGLFLNRLRHL